MEEIIEIDLSKVDLENIGNTLYSSRRCFSEIRTQKKHSNVTIYIQAYNGLDKTRRCVESILKYTTGIDYDLLLIDNGSTDGTFDYFKSIDFEAKRIIRFTENKGASVPHLFLSPDMVSRYVVFVANDLIVTHNWLSNLLRVAESDSKIGLVNPMSSNVSNLQDPGLTFSGYDDMQKKAAAFNVSDPGKWEERLRIITLGFLVKKECLFAMGMPIADVGFAHNFSDDDMAFRIRRAGYKAILAGDTWVHHDDDKKNLPIEKAVRIQKDLNIGRENFRDKYFGIDAWDDINNFIPRYLQVLKQPGSNEKPSVLGIDTRCGTPILEIKNHLRSYNIFDADCYAYTTDGKYVIDLQTICGANRVFVGEINRFRDHFDAETLDYIVIGNDINTYNDPFNIIKSAFGLLKKGGQLFISLQNVNNIFEFLYSIGNVKVQNPVHALNYTVEEFLGKLQQKGYNARFISASYFSNTVVSESLAKSVYDILKMLSVKEIDETIFRLRAERFYYVIEK